MYFIHCQSLPTFCFNHIPYGFKYSRDNIFVNFVSTLQITKILHSKISVFMSFCITYKQALLKNLPSNELKVQGFSTILAAKIMRYSYVLPNDRGSTQLLANTPLLHRTIKSNAMVVDTTCMQAGPADPRAGAYD